MLSLVRISSILLALCVFLAACTTSFVSAYDQKIVSGLDEQNKKAMVLFASVATGSRAGQFSRYKTNYDDTIGGMESVRLMIKSRYIPLGNAVSNKLVQSICPPGVQFEECLNSSSANMDQVVKTLQRMRDQHEKNGLAPAVVDLFKRDYELGMQRILVVEAALK
jgi:hypothetical protein